MSIAKTIAEQIGGRALFMIGAKELIAGKNYLQFRIGRNPKGWTKICVQLNGLDLYDMIFCRIRKKQGIPEVVENKTLENIYCDQLCDIIESETGLRTSL